jgi:hypothetical protein
VFVKDELVIAVHEGSVILGGSEETAENGGESHEEIPVVAPARDEPEVIEEDDERTYAEKDEHQNGNPLRADLDISGNRWCVTR